MFLINNFLSLFSFKNATKLSSFNDIYLIVKNSVVETSKYCEIFYTETHKNNSSSQILLVHAGTS